jgi:GNAT superfamily N-acetyltransferase
MSAVMLRRLSKEDRPAVDHLLDEALGRGFWDPSRDLDDIVVVAVEHGRLVGVGSASIEADAKPSEGSVGHLRLVAVVDSARRHGVATSLVSELSTLCETRGAETLVAYAWVHGQDGIAPLAGVLERAGYRFDRRIEHFYRAAVADPCPACGQAPCVCPADLYRRDVGGAQG